MFQGDNAYALLKARPKLFMVLVDPWSEKGGHVMPGQKWPEADQSEWDEMHDNVRKRIATLGKGRVNIFRGLSKDVENITRNGFFDFVFLDADHTYEGTYTDIMRWAPKVKPGGFISGHDYGNQKEAEMYGWGVDRAVTEFSQEIGLPVEVGPGYTWFIHVPSQV